MLLILAALAGAWAALLLLAPWLPVPAAGVLYLFGGRMCHQIAERSFHVDGAQLPVCARCLGIYAGAAVALMAPGLRRLAHAAPRAPAHVRGLVLGALALNALTLVLEWATRWQPSNAVRAGAGAALGIAVALAIREALRDPANGTGTVDYERCRPPRQIRSGLPSSRT
ncbi:MAG: DUF2085 domain-containing protein [Acidobacteria bacterium]|nr:DUF2085 domain-containing protein [Acidobacteriota bacterium]